MRVLSLFDGYSGALQALKDLGIKVDKYYASEIDKHAIQIANKNHPEIIQLGDVHDINKEMVGEIDLLIGGPSCQSFSFAGKQLNFNDPRGMLFFEYVRILKEVKPKHFLVENVKMKKEFQDVISEHLGVEPIEINSSLLTAQSRKRMYWTDIPNVELPKDMGILLRDIVHESEEGFDFEVVKPYMIDTKKALTILDSEVARRKIGYFGTDSQGNRVYTIHDKSVTLCGEAGGLGAKTGLYLFGCLTPDRTNKRQNGQRFNEGKKFYTLTAQDRHGILVDGYIRKLTPIECERLQGLKDGYTSGVSNNQRYKMLGNGFTVPIISHILNNME